jgi:putative ABC transport system permease protein
MSVFRLVLASLWHFRRIHFAVALGVAAATAVLTGALLVGDSVRGSLRQLTLERLGRIDEILVTDRFFRAELADELARTPAFEEHYSTLAPVVLFPSVTLEATKDGHARRAANVLAVGSDERFWKLGDVRFPPKKLPTGNEIVLNAPLAEALGVEIGDQVLLRLPSASDVPADSALGRKNDRVETASGLKVIDIIAAESLGRFALRPSQSLPRNAYLSTEKLQAVLEQPGRLNALLIAGKSPTAPPDEAASAALASALKPTLDDFGVRVDHVRLAYPDKNASPVYDYLHVTTDSMIFAPAAKEAVEAALKDIPHQPVLTYLANTIALEGKDQGIPYSTVAAIDSLPETGPAIDEQGQPVVLKDDEIALNSWSAEDLGAKVGDPVRLAYFAPETTHGQAIEKTATFTLKAIVPLTEPSAGFHRRGREQLPATYRMRPTTANDHNLTPVVAGITDQASIDDWDPPFPFDQKRIRTQDDTYWENHRTTPKAYIAYAAGQKLWGSRFGNVTSFRIPHRDDLNAEQLRQKLLVALHDRQADLGFVPLRVKQQGLSASAGATPFDVLFLFLSFFIIAAALMLVSVLFKLGIDQRLTQIGTLLALGWQRRQAARAMLLENVLVATIGSALGLAVGLGYAWLMIAGLRTWWVGAITTPFLTMHVSPQSLIIGFFSGIVVSSLTIWLGLRHLNRVPARALLAGQTESQLGPPRRRPVWNVIAIALLIAAIALAAYATQLGGEAQAGAFVGGGAALLTALLLLIFNALRPPTSARLGRLSLTWLAIGAARRNPSRSTMTIGLMAAACFLIVALSSFRLAPTESGTGGFDLVATTSEPIFADLNSSAGRADLFGENAKTLDDATILGLRYRAGDDASCNNLYQATQPRIIGATAAFAAHFDDPAATPFSFAASAAQDDATRKNPWHLLTGPAVKADEPIPAVLDKNTAMYSLHLYRGIGEEFKVKYEDGPELTFKVAGLLSNSILQGGLIIGERDFLARFPGTSGYRFFLVQAPEERLAAVKDALGDRLSDQGFDPQSTRALLTELLRVQNTYLSTFQSLGALGLLLGTFGLATVQLRSVLERRKELALLRAEGFASTRIARLVMTESVLLLVGGLATGMVAALMAVVPHVLFGGASLQLRDPGVMLAVVLAAGLLTSLLAVRATLTTDVIAALRGE